MNSFYHHDFENAAQRRQRFLEQAAMDRLAKEANRAGRSTNAPRVLLANTGRLLVAVGQKMQAAAQGEGAVLSAEC